jgi:predicted PurR-regulated permease PerM
MNQYPLYIRATVILLFFFFGFAGMYFARDFLIPICIAALMSILLFPIARFLEKKLRFHRLLANFSVILMVMIFLGGLVWLIYSQISGFLDDLPGLQAKVDLKLKHIQLFVKQKTGVGPYRQILWMQQQLQSLLTSSGTVVKSTLLSTTTTLATFGMIQFYIFFFLHYREKFKNFILRVMPEQSHRKVQNIIIDTRAVIQSYISGVFIVVFIMSICIGSGLMALGIPFAIFLAVLTGFLNIIPYIGVFISAILACAIAFLTMDSGWFVLGTFLVYLVTHLLESNLFTPSIVGSKVSVNPLATFVALVIGSNVWGIMGMILFIPLLGIFKVICDNVPALQAYAYLLSTEGTEEHNFSFRNLWNKNRRVRGG